MSNIPFIVMSILLIIYIILSVRKGRLSVSASFVWILFCICMLFLSIFPRSMDWLSSIFGISYPPALFLTICIVILFALNFKHDKQIDELEGKINNLAQEINIIKIKKSDDEKRK